MRFPEDVPLLTDGRVRLRAATPADAGGSYQQCQDPDSVRWTTVPVPYTRADAREYVERILPQGWVEDRDYSFVVEAPDPATGDLRYAGSVGLRPQGLRRAEVAYGSHPWCRGRGVLEAALRLLLDWGFDVLGLETVIWWAHRGNWASRRLAWRLGFTVEGTVRSWLGQRGELRDAWVGTLLAGDPRQPRQPWYDVPVLTGDTVVLRALRPDDAERIVEYCVDPQTRHWLADLPDPYTTADAEEFLESRTEQAATGAGLTWAVAEPGDGRLLGTIALFDLVPERAAEVGYATHPAARRRGVTTQAGRLALRHAFLPEADGGLGLARLRVRAADGNTGSLRVIDRLGFTPTGRERQGSRLRDGSTVDTLCFDLLAAEWAAAERVRLEEAERAAERAAG